MKKVATLLLLAFLSVCLFSPAATADSFPRKVIVYVKGTINVTLDTDCEGPGGKTINTDVGEPGGCYITIRNKGNIEDRLKIKGRETDSPDSDPGWIDYHFECPGSIGECSFDYSYSNSYYPPEVRDIVLSPDVDSTRIYLEATPYKAGNPNPVGSIELRGYSQTNKTEDDFVTIDVNSNSPDPAYGAFVAPGLSNASVLLLFILSSSLFAFAKFR